MGVGGKCVSTFLSANRDHAGARQHSRSSKCRTLAIGTNVDAGTRQHCSRLIKGFQYLPNAPEHLVDLPFPDDQRRRQGDDVAGGANQQPAVEGAVEQLGRARAWRAVTRAQLDAGNKTKGSNVDDVPPAAQGVRCSRAHRPL